MSRSPLTNNLVSESDGHVSERTATLLVTVIVMISVCHTVNWDSWGSEEFEGFYKKFEWKAANDDVCAIVSQNERTNNETNEQIKKIWNLK